MEETDDFLFIFNLVVVCYAAVVITLNATSKELSNYILQRYDHQQANVAFLFGALYKKAIDYSIV